MKVVVDVNRKSENWVNELLAGKTLSISKAGVVRGIGRQLRELREKNFLTIARDAKYGMSLLKLNGEVKKVEREYKVFGGTIFSIIFK